jgi:hypothetical protein
MTTVQIQPEDRTKYLYLDPVNGNDLNVGTEEAPIKTFAAIWPKVQYDANGGTFEKYRGLLIKAGTVVPDGIWLIYGGWRYGSKNPKTPFVIGCYGEGERPVIMSKPGQNGIYIKDSPGNIVIQDLEFVGTKSAKGIEVFGPQDNISIINCVVRNYAYGMAFDCQRSSDVIKNLSIDNCIIIDNIVQSNDPNDKGSQGIYISQCVNPKINDTVVDNNGLKNTFCHGIYAVQSNIGLVVTACCISRNGFAGLQGRGRDTSAFECLFFGNANNLAGGHHMSTTLPNNQGDFIWWNGQYNRNLIGYANDIAAKPGDAGARGWALSWHRGQGYEIAENIILGENRPTSRVAFQRPTNAPSDYGVVKDNWIIGYDVYMAFSTPASESEYFENNTYLRMTNKLSVVPTINYDLILDRNRTRRRHEKYVKPITYYNQVKTIFGL